MAFFSDSHIHSLTTILGHSRLRDLLDAMGEAMHQHAHGIDIDFSAPDPPVRIPHEEAAHYITVYFDDLHPLAPFLDRADFERRVSDPGLSELLENNAPFCALYHTLLALGCQYMDGGSFTPGEGKAWKYFQCALSLFPKILAPPQGLLHVQGIFTMSFSCIPIGETLISEAARIVQLLGYNAAYVQTEDERSCHRAFWVIYWLEKVTSFFRGRGSMIPDYDIGCPVPGPPDTVPGQLDWLLTTARLGRLMSRTYECLFSVSAVQMHTGARIAAIDSMSRELEAWNRTLPEPYQPGDSIRFSKSKNPCAQDMALQIRFIYYALVMSMCRLRIHLMVDQPSETNQETKRQLMEAARAVIYHTRYIEHEAHVPVWQLGIVPISALFVIFDFVIHNPLHKETATNISFLDIAAGYFSRWEISKKDSLPASSVAEFSHIARQFVRDVQARSQTIGSRRTSHLESDNIGPMTGGKNDASGFPMQPSHVMVGSSYEPPSISLADIAPVKNEEPLVLPDIEGSSAIGPDQLFYPEDPLQTLLGTYLPPTTDLSNMFNSALWYPGSL
ncbi:hypothetical protein ASPNIDRAFT_43524 [Aspergillus niger ATCC 1015]|uniref:Xylanolytic transcriptional activator regulatory domain-containing protein n=1 Tax=Aspergillus niger (strain ATCC 1015 / CBS 113.46 / FGSC A1144 / LSHB Ac4 / NCTC 3858a / NRRL 328 / USDA 3528.7) TaxID=380704 RepID=G3XM50_ASPNA|nr:hypothetical protein ASPNIDRAFT_43524 [Aspergillus niger ATCC 1015]